jgi:Na+:H+ antiporter, NhaA family
MFSHPLFRRPHRYIPGRVVQAAQAFVRTEASSGIVLLAAAVVALVWANSPWDDVYFDLWHTPIVVDASIFRIDQDLLHWLNDGLMTLFFFVVGLEIKRELVHGELSGPRKAILPAAAALGGMVAPAVIYTALNLNGDGADGWGIPMATDIAFALGVLSLLSGRVPFSIKVFLLALAISDDIGSILVIATFYTERIDVEAAVAALCVLAAIVGLNRAGVRNIGVYLALGLCLWLATLLSGVHATIAGVVLGLLAPASALFERPAFAGTATSIIERFRQAQMRGNKDELQSALADMEALSQGTEPPLDRLERAVHPWVSYVVVPLFALANAGFAVSHGVLNDAATSPITQGILLARLIGKPLGVFTVCWLAVRVGGFELPAGASWPHILGVGILSGIGFSVSLLVADLALPAGLLDEAKLGILAASIVSGVIGFGFLWFVSGSESEPSRA